jgi:hypothetical protein
MINPRSILEARSANAAPLGVQLVGDDGPGFAPFFDALAEKALGCGFVTPGLYQNVATIPVGIDCPPQPVLSALDQNHNRVQMPLIN